VDARLTIAGALHEPSTLNRLRQLARRRRVDDSVAFVIAAPDAMVSRLHRESDYFLFTSRSESFGLALLEAIGHGVLPIVYPHPVYRTLVESSGFGVIARRADPAALADGVWQALAGSPGRGDDGERVHWLRERSWPRVMAPLARALERLRPAAEGSSPVPLVPHVV
jgi:glycosyltransferase involved in cell wall biosynthesis